MFILDPISLLYPKLMGFFTIPSMLANVSLNE